MNMIRKLLYTCLLFIAAPAWGLDGDAILAKVDRNLAPDSYEMYRKLVNREPDGSRKEFVLYTAKKGRTKMVALFLSPASDLGRTTLRIGENMWLYIPKVGKPLRITSLQSVVGGVFNNSDLMRLEFSAEYKVQNIVEKNKTYILTLKARNKSVAYDKLKMHVNQDLLLPTVIEAYAASGLLVKTLRYKKIKDYGNGIVRPSVLETDSPLYKGYKSVMVFAKITPRKFPDEVFSLNYMPRIQELR
ncbi:MAG: outer membrane lipoprotein-sorting protein [Gammaproteobacteria bacterium]